MHKTRTLPAIFAIFLTAAVLLACGATATVTTTGSGGTTATTTGSTSTSTTGSTTTAPATCATLVSGATTASAGTAFTDVSYPTGAVANGLTLHHSGTGLWSVYLQNACAPGTTASAVRSYYATQLPAHGWAYAPTLPFDGGYQAPCGDAYCWAKDTAPRYVGLEAVTDAGGGNVTFTLRFFVPPTAPGCSVGDTLGVYSGKTYQSTWTDGGSVPLPPLTLFGLGSGFSKTAYDADGYTGMCSAGTAASVNTFFTTELPRLGWTFGPLPTLFAPCQQTGSAWYKGRATFSVDTANGSTVPNGVTWSMGICNIH